MAGNGNSKSAEIRKRLGYPVIDGDGHTVEHMPLFMDYLKEVGGQSMVDRFHASRNRGWYHISPEERLEKRAMRPPWWALPTRNTLDRATAMLPKLRSERMEELGIDFSIVYTTMGLLQIRDHDDELRQASCRALNMMHADMFRDYAYRMTPAAVIPMHTPEEAIVELEHSVKELGMKAAMVAGVVTRPIPAAKRLAGDGWKHSHWVDSLGLGSAYDYDPVWAKLVELKVAPTAHTGGMGWGSRRQPNNYMYNHIGHFASAGDAFCKALFMGGVTRRFPTLKFAFLEGGVAWAAMLYHDLVGHWEKRNPEALELINPANLDVNGLIDYFKKYGGPMTKGKGEEELKASIEDYARVFDDPDALDDLAACGIGKAEDITGLFVPNFYFGCEADDPSNATAFNCKGGVKLKAIFSSDIGHWDVPDMTECLEEAYELVEEGRMSEEDFRDFVFTNPASLHAGMNPDFFKGTAVEHEVDKLISEEAA